MTTHTQNHQATRFSKRLRRLADAVEKDHKRFHQTVEALQLAATGGVATGEAKPRRDDDDDGDEIDWQEVAFIAILILF